jgi:hypothetical protein
MTTYDLILQWLLILGAAGAVVCMGLWVCERLDARDVDNDEDWWG